MPILVVPAFVISGSPKVGKTSLAAAIAKELECPLASFGDYVRSQARSLLGNGTLSRQRLQDIGQELVSRDPETFCRGTLSSIAPSQGQPIVIDGLRHVMLLPVLAKLCGNREIRVVFVEATLAARIARWGAKITRLELNAIDTHPVEADMAQIREIADIVVETKLGFEEALVTLMQWIKQSYPGLIPEIVRRAPAVPNVELNSGVKT